MMISMELLLNIFKQPMKESIIILVIIMITNQQQMTTVVLFIPACHTISPSQFYTMEI